MTIQPPVNIYTQGTGSHPQKVEVPFVTSRAPTTADTNYPIGKRGIYEAQGQYVLISFSTSAGYLEANWVQESSPSVITFEEDSGSAIPSGGILHVLGTSSQGISTSGLGDTITITAADATTATKGVAFFNPAEFTVAAGEVSLIGGGAAIDSIGVQTGTSPVVGNGSGQVTFNGAVVAAGTNPVRTDGTGANTMALEVQISQAIAATDATKIGLCNFDSGNFSVDANGFVQLNGSTVGETITGNSGGALSPTAGNWNILGSSVVAGTTPVTTVGSGSTLTIDVQRSQAIASTDATKIGLSAFDSARFTVDANGFVSLLGTGVLETLTGNSGGAISPTAGNINTLGTGSITIAGSGSTLTTQLTGLTNHNVLVGAGTATITNVAPSATTGVPLISQGSSSDPLFGTALIAGGGSAATSFNTNGVVISNTTSTGALAALSLTSGQVVIGGTTTPAAATLTAGTGITINNGNNSITISASTSGFSWTDVTSPTQSMAVENGYITDRGAGVVYTLPSTASLGDTMLVVGKLGLATITPNANQQILIGSASGTVGATGTAVSNNVGDCLELVCITAGSSTIWRAFTVVGTWTLN